MKRATPPENSPRVLAVALALWSGSVALAGWEGIFAKLSPITFGLLALFAMVFCAASYGLDRGLRQIAAHTQAAALWSAILVADGIVVATAFAIAASDAPALESLARFPYAMSALFVAPLALALHIAAFGRGAARKGVRRAPARSPGGSPAAT
jgi:cellobiose-specific phosphotransferase system component IIC